MKIKLFKKEKVKYMAIFCVMEGNSYNFLEYLNIKPNQRKIDYDEKNTFVIDIENPTYRKRNVRYYCIDINSGQIQFQRLKKDEIVSSRINSMIMADQIIYQLAKASTKPFDTTYNFTSLIIGMVIGTLIGFIIKIFIQLPI